MLCRVFISDMGKFEDSKNYEYVAEFADQDLAGRYIVWMRGKKRFAKKDIIVRECEGKEIDPTEGKVAVVITVLGELLPVEEYKFI